jgi:hypothetical protein
VRPEPNCGGGSEEWGETRTEVGETIESSTSALLLQSSALPVQVSMLRQKMDLFTNPFIKCHIESHDYKIKLELFLENKKS